MTEFEKSAKRHINFDMNDDLPIAKSELKPMIDNARKAEELLKYPVEWYLARDRWFMSTQYEAIMKFETSYPIRLSTAFSMGLLCGWQDRKRFVAEKRRKRKKNKKKGKGIRGDIRAD